MPKMLSIHFSLVALLAALSPVDHAVASSVEPQNSRYYSAATRLARRADGPPAPDQNSTSLCGAIQHIGQDEGLVNITSHFTVPTMHLRHGQPSPQGISFSTVIDLDGCDQANFRFGINSVIYGDETQRDDFFYHWSPETAQTIFLDFPLNANDEIDVWLEPSSGTSIKLTLSNLSKANAKIFNLAPQDNKNSLCFGNFGFIIEDPSLVTDDIPTSDSRTGSSSSFSSWSSSDNPPVGLADFSAVSYTYVGGITAGGKEYGLDGAELVYMTDASGARYRVVALDLGSSGHHLVFEGQADN